MWVRFRGCVHLQSCAYACKVFLVYSGWRTVYVFIIEILLRIFVVDNWDEKNVLFHRYCNIYITIRLIGLVCQIDKIQSLIARNLNWLYFWFTRSTDKIKSWYVHVFAMYVTNINEKARRKYDIPLRFYNTQLWREIFVSKQCLRLCHYPCTYHIDLY